MSISTKKNLELHLAARCPLNYVVSWENDVVARDLKNVTDRLFEEAYTWSVTEGLNSIAEPSTETRLQGPYEVLEAISASKSKAIYFLNDFHPYITDSRVTRKLRDCYHALQAASACLVIVSPKVSIPLELEKEMSVFHYPLPDLQQIGNIYAQILRAVKQNNSLKIELTDEEQEQLIQAGMGLTERELKNVFAKALVKDRKLDINDIDVILDEKRQIIEKNGFLEFYSTNENFGNVGGLRGFKSWIELRSRVLKDRKASARLPTPKGVLITGVPGTGKSLVAKAISSEWRWPLLRLDVGKLFGGIVGSSEHNIRETIAIAEAVAPAVLWVDEIEKGFVGVMSGGDSGASSRVFSTFLTWLQEKRSSIFLVATANNISALPPEFLRKGRFDETFFVDLPNADERTEIFRIHLARHSSAAFTLEDYDALVKQSDGFTGAEIEQVILSALYAALSEGEELSRQHIAAEIAATYPLSKTMKEQIDAMREWAQYRARSASSSEDTPAGVENQRWSNL
ncbi:MAG: AAA family ATPase [Pseudomonadota bacterium]